jgi:hypothetical protein
MRTPISRVRSVTETNMMFMMPMPPTSSETAATLASKVVSTPVTVLIRVWISRMSRTLKSSSSPFMIRRRWRISASICALASSVRSSEAAEIMIMAT